MKGLAAGAQSVSASELRRRQELSRGLAQDTANDASRFAEYDLDANRKLDFEEFLKMQPASVHAKHSREEIRKWFDAADDNGDGELSIEEFFKWSLHKASQKFGETTLNTVFEKFDKDRSGYLNAWEFEQAATEMGFGGVKDKVHVHDLQATIMHLLGFDHERLTYRFQGRDYRLTDVHGHVVREILA
jgi:Ca2+-binding EF-hand superfamily protein